MVQTLFKGEGADSRKEDSRGSDRSPEKETGKPRVSGNPTQEALDRDCAAKSQLRRQVEEEEGAQRGMGLQ